MGQFSPEPESQGLSHYITLFPTEREPLRYTYIPCHGTKFDKF